jgi:regulator of protease activity HflC (stomatin/prohibitin superfamily)
LRAGINPVNPLARVVKYSIQTQEHKETMQVLSREGLTIGLEVSALYRLNPDSAARVYKTVSGGDYETIILIPQFRSICRSVTASFQASALYSTEREALGASIQEELAKTIGRRGVTIETTPIRNVALPTQLTEAIEQKQKADQESQRMEFILTKEKQEADRKRIEAKGIADFQKIVAAGISEQLLRWKVSIRNRKGIGNVSCRLESQVCTYSPRCLPLRKLKCGVCHLRKRSLHMRSPFQLQVFQSSIGVALCLISL